MTQMERELSVQYHPEQHHNVERVTLGNLSFGIYFPEEFITNAQIEKWKIQTKSGNLLTAQGIHEKIGIDRRFIANLHESSIDMGTQAAIATESLSGVNAVIVSSSYPLGVNISEEIAARLHIKPNFHLDIHAACSGFVRGLAYMKEHEEEFQGKKVLFVAAEKYSHTLADLREGGMEIDKSMAQLIFSDGAVACTFEFGKDIRVLGYENKKLENRYANSIRMPIDPHLMEMPFLEEQIFNSKGERFQQDGKDVMQGVLSNVPKLNERVVANAGLQASDIKLVIPHQATGIMIDGLSKRMSGYTLFRDLGDGNFSSASIPKALMRAIREGKIQRGYRILLSGFGAGLYASSAIIELG
jgi:3-oxoacyl-[acyl-carrier-protein] synthase-3